MFKHYFEQVQNIEVFPVISLIIFFSFFLLLIIWLFKVDKKHISEMRHLPLDLDVTKNESQHSENTQS
ncbi:hypothetical protein [Microscilla marina]|uniref:CcoQ/FixQ family Cbb3-type cytochrome c oxidase assembly chaperone n=1 Tax=Microscilla marina ATCC 23134 TaxID=313606 RepID=A1ZN77_MICM2|nr:hypothetical protein [Microscilla marina]EAY28258.1 hypothetical protein M23134_03519 [Microscilla marina ATCC 23134]